MALPRLGQQALPRPRLLARLDGHATLTVVRAPAGFGKTALVAQWLAGRQAPDEITCWLRVRRGTDSGGLWIALVDALTDAGLPMPPLAERRSPQDIAERMIDRADRAVLLVVDGLENVADAAVDDALLELLWHTPHLRLIVCLRSHRYFTSDRYVDLDAAVIEASELLFTADETAELFALAGVDLSPGQAAAIHAETGGWPEPIRLLASTLRDSGGDVAPDQAIATIATDYLRRRLLPEATRSDRVEFALLTSLPDEFTLEVAELLTGDLPAESQLDWLDAHGLMCAEIRDGEPVYRWPGAARRALAAELARRVPERLPELHARLAGWYFDRGEPGPALRHARLAADWPLVVTVIEAAWRELLIDGSAELYEALVATPGEVTAASPRATAVRDIRLRPLDDRLLAVAGLPDDPGDLIGLGRDPRANQTVDTGLAVLIALRRRGLFRRAHRHGEQLRAITDAARGAHPAEIAELYPNVHLHVGHTAMLADDLPGAVAPLERAYQYASDSPLGYVQADAAGGLALAHAVTGETRQASVWLDRYDVAPAPTTWLAPQIRDKATAARLLVALDRLDAAGAQASRDALTDHIGPIEFWAYYAYARAQHAMGAGTILAALDLLERARAVHGAWLDNSSTARPLLAAAEADLLLALGRGNHARAALHGTDADHPLLRVAQARLALLTDDLPGALRHTSDSSWPRPASARHRLEMLLIGAVAAQRSDDVPAAASRLRRATAIAQETGSLRAFTTVPRHELVALTEYVPAAAELLVHPALAAAPDLFPKQVTLIRLTDREQRVLRELASARTLQQIADDLVVSYNTVKSQQRSLYRKLGATSRASALSLARQWGLLTR